MRVRKKVGHAVLAVALAGMGLAGAAAAADAASLTSVYNPTKTCWPPPHYLKITAKTSGNTTGVITWNGTASTWAMGSSSTSTTKVKSTTTNNAGTLTVTASTSVTSQSLSCT
ncbi:MAG: hypothetical protein AAGC49_05640 [Brevundimonas sp.]